MDYSTLPWNFEAFRKFITFQAIQNAAGVITLYDGTETTNSKKMLEFQHMLNSRSGLIWEPSRQNSEDVLYNSEGNVFRNKARVLTSLYLLSPFELKKGTISATKFCRLLASGKISEKEFHDFIINSYEFPHPAYDENWNAWKDANTKLKPFIFILQLLLSLYNDKPDSAYLTVDEFARFAHSQPFHDKIDNIVSEILKHRMQPELLESRTRSDKIDRKINDVFGFMCMTKYTYFEGSKIRLNLVDKHPEELVNFYISRGGISIPDEIFKTITRGLR